jgi:hypothetical protein
MWLGNRSLYRFEVVHLIKLRFALGGQVGLTRIKVSWDWPADPSQQYRHFSGRRKGWSFSR